MVSGAMLACSFGTAPGTLNVTSQASNLAEGKPIATIKDTAPNVNIPSFGMCTSMANPQVAAATAAALGVLTPQPCLPAAAGSWIPTKPAVLVANTPCLCNDSALMCMNGMGCITISTPGQKTGLV